MKIVVWKDVIDGEDTWTAHIVEKRVCTTSKESAVHAACLLLDWVKASTDPNDPRVVDVLGGRIPAPSVPAGYTPSADAVSVLRNKQRTQDDVQRVVDEFNKYAYLRGLRPVVCPAPAAFYEDAPSYVGTWYEQGKELPMPFALPASVTVRERGGV